MRFRRAVRLKVLNVRPGDIVVLETDRPMSAEAHQRLKRVWEEWFPSIPVAVLEGVKVKTILRQVP